MGMAAGQHPTAGGCFWRSIGDPGSVARVTGSRIKLLSLDASPSYVILGSSIGSVYVFGRCAEFGGLRDPARTKIESPEGPLRFLERFLVETHSGASASKPIVAIRLNPDSTRCALAFEDGELEVVEFSMGDGGEKKTGRVSGRYEAGIPEAHRGATVTSLAWSPAAAGHGGDAFVCGDNRGVCSVVVLEGKHAGAHTIRFNQPIAQVSFLEDGSAALVSTSEKLYLLYRRDGFSKSCVGSKPRDGPFGAVAHPIAHMGVPEGFELDVKLDLMGAKAAAGHDWFFGARPGRRLWLCRVPHGSAVPKGEVVATLRPSLPEASAPPGGVMPAKLPKKWEFGRVHAIGPCLLSVSDKALAVVDFVGAAVLAWYPLDFSPGSKTGGDGGHRLGLAVEGPRAFMLGGDGGVWCLQAPHTAVALVRSTAMLAAAAGASSPEMTEDEKALLADPGYHAKRLAARFGIDPPPMPRPPPPPPPPSSSSDRTTAMGGDISRLAGDSVGGSDRGLVASSKRVRELMGAIAATNAAGDGAASMFDEADPSKWRNGSSSAAGFGGVSSGSASYPSYFPAAEVVGGNDDDFPAASTSDEPIGIITRTRNPRARRSASKRVAGIEDLPVAALSGQNDGGDGDGALSSANSGGVPPPLGIAVGVLRHDHEERTQSEAGAAAALASAALGGDGGFDFHPPFVRHTRAYEGEGSDDDTMSTVSEALTERTDGGDAFFGSNGSRLSSLAYSGPSVRQIDVVIRPATAEFRAGFGSPVPAASGEATAAAPPVVVDDDGNLLLDDLETSAVPEPSEKTPDNSPGPGLVGCRGVGGGWGGGRGTDAADEGDAAMSPSIDLWLEKKEEARKADAAAREAVTSPPGPAAPSTESTFTGAEPMDDDDYDALVREAESLALELDRVAHAEARKAAEDAGDQSAEKAKEKKRAAAAGLERTADTPLITDGSDYSSGDNDGVDDGIDDDAGAGAGAPLPFGAVAAPPKLNVRTVSPERARGSGGALEIPASPQASSSSRVVQLSPWPWWMVMLGCDGCRTVRPNKQHKYTFEHNAAVSRSASLSEGTDLVEVVFGSSSGLTALPRSRSRRDVDRLN